MTDVVVPAHNEETTIGAVISVLRTAKSISEVIVVADNCEDGTAAVASATGALVVVSSAGAKGAAMMAGLNAVRTPRVMFCDADITGLAPSHVDLLCDDPVPGQVAGLFDHDWGNAVWYGLPPITGQRVLPTIIAQSVTLDGYLAEIQLDNAVGIAGLHNRHWILAGVTNRVRNPGPVAGMYLTIGAYAVTHIYGLTRYTARIVKPTGNA